MIKTIDELYNVSTQLDIPMLSDYTASFWQEYRQNYKRYDKLFRRLYKSFKYFMQDGSEDTEDVLTDFIDDVYNHLMANHKKYSELYRVYMISDDEYSIIDNYRITETMDKDTTSNNDNNYGSRNDTSGSIHNVVPYNTFTEYEDSSMNDTFSKGSEHDTLNNTGTEDYVLTRRGNIGVQTGADMLEKHSKYWDKYTFMTQIFKEICAELLLV